MKTITFRYNKFNSDLFARLIMGIIVISGFLILIALFNLSQHMIPSFFEQNKGLSLILTLLTPCIWLIISMILGLRFGREMAQAQGKIEIYENYAMVYVKNRVLRVDKESTQIEEKYKKIMCILTLSIKARKKQLLQLLFGSNIQRCFLGLLCATPLFPKQCPLYLPL